MEELSEPEELITQEDIRELNHPQQADKVAQFQKKYLEYMKDYWENTQKILLQVRDAEKKLELIKPWKHITTKELEDLLDDARRAEIQAGKQRGMFFDGNIGEFHQAVLDEAREEDIRNQRAEIEAYLDERYGDDPEKKKEKGEAREVFLWLAEKARAKDQMARDKDRMSYIHHYFGGSSISKEEEDILEEWEAGQKDIIRRVMGPLESKTGFANVDLSQMHPRFRYAVLAALAAVEEVFHINEQLRQCIVKKLQELIEDEWRKAGGAPEDDAELEFRPEKQEAMMYAESQSGIRYKPHPLKEKEIDLGIIGCAEDRKCGWTVSAERKIPHDEMQIVLPFVLTVLHESGHQYEDDLIDDCFRALPSELKERMGIPNTRKNVAKINQGYQNHLKDANKVMETNSFRNLEFMNAATVSKKHQLDNELSTLKEESECFDAFVCREFMQYTMAITEKEFGEKPTAGLIFKPGGRAKSLSLYAKSNTKDFFAELFSQVLMTDPEYLTPLGKTLRKLLNSDGKPFIQWFVRKNKKDHGKAYREHRKYFEEHNGYEKCPPFPSKMNETDVLIWAIQMGQISNYNIAENEKQAERMQKKLGNAVVVSERLRKEWPDISDKFRTWREKKMELLRMSEYCASPKAAKSLIPNCYSWLDILDTLLEKDPNDFRSKEACAEFLNAEIKSVEEDLKKAKAQQRGEPNLQAVPTGTQVKMIKENSLPLVPVLGRSQDSAARHPLPQRREAIKVS